MAPKICYKYLLYVNKPGSLRNENVTQVQKNEKRSCKLFVNSNNPGPLEN